MIRFKEIKITPNLYTVYSMSIERIQKYKIQKYKFGPQFVFLYFVYKLAVYKILVYKKHKCILQDTATEKSKLCECFTIGIS